MMRQHDFVAPCGCSSVRGVREWCTPHLLDPDHPTLVHPSSEDAASLETHLWATAKLASVAVVAAAMLSSMVVFHQMEATINSLLVGALLGLGVGMRVRSWFAERAVSRSMWFGDADAEFQHMMDHYPPPST